MIYFNAELQAPVRDLLYRGLKRYGVLAVGNRESLSASPEDSLYEALDNRERIYRKRAKLVQTDPPVDTPRIAVEGIDVAKG